MPWGLCVSDCLSNFLCCVWLVDTHRALRSGFLLEGCIIRPSSKSQSYNRLILRFYMQLSISPCFQVFRSINSSKAQTSSPLLHHSAFSLHPLLLALPPCSQQRPLSNTTCSPPLVFQSILFSHPTFARPARALCTRPSPWRGALRYPPYSRHSARPRHRPRDRARGDPLHHLHPPGAALARWTGSFLPAAPSTPTTAIFCY